jgi:hypothetical protein
MKRVRTVAFWSFLAVWSVGLVACGKKADENKPMSEVKAEAERMSVEELRAMAMKYKEAISAKKAETERVIGKQISDIPVAKKLGGEATELSTEMDNLSKSLSALKERFQVYYDKLKEKGGDLSDLGV